MTFAAKLGAVAGAAALAVAGFFVAKNLGQGKGGGNPAPCGDAQPTKVVLAQLAGRWVDDETGEKLALTVDPKVTVYPVVSTSAPSGVQKGTGPDGAKPSRSADKGTGPTETGLDGSQVPTPKIIAGKGPTPNVTGTGRHDDWKGIYDGTTLKLSRYPSAQEMDETAPGWAKDQAYEKVKWELELTPKTDCEGLVLEGNWYPGSFKWHEEVPNLPGSNDLQAVPSSPGPGDVGTTQPGSAEGARTISDIGRGTPIKVSYRMPPPAIVDVAVLENQIKYDAGVGPFYQYPFNKKGNGGFREGVGPGNGATIRTLYVYGVGLPLTRDQKITVTSSDPNIDYWVLAVKRDAEVNPSLKTRYFVPGLEKAKLAKAEVDGPAIEKMDAVILRVDLKPGTSPGLMPGVKSFKINDIAGSWTLRFGDDVVTVTMARASRESLDSPSVLNLSEAEPLEATFLPERVFIEIHTEPIFPADTIALLVGVGGKKVTWNGSKTIAATRVPGTDTVYRTPAIELVRKGGISPNQPGAYFLPVSASDIISASIDDPNLFRQVPRPAQAKVYTGPGDLGNTYPDYLLRAAKADGIDTSSIHTSDLWATLAGRKAASIKNLVAFKPLLKDLSGKQRPQQTWKRELIRQFLIKQDAVLGRLIYYLYFNDEILESVDLTVADHAALLFYRDAFADEMTAMIQRLMDLKRDYDAAIQLANGANAARSLSDAIRFTAKLRGLREILKSFAWSDESPWMRLKVTCPNGSCQFADALSDSFLEKNFPNDQRGALKWAVGAVAEAMGQMIDNGNQALGKAKAVADKDVKGLVEAVGYFYEPLLPRIMPRMMRLNEARKWVPDTQGRYSLLRLHTVTDALSAQQALAHEDTMALVTLASVPVCAMAVPAIASIGLEEAVVGIALGTADLFLTEVGSAIYDLPDTHYALGASLAVGTEHLNEVELQRNSIFYRTITNLIIGTYKSGGFILGLEGAKPIALRIAQLGKSAAHMARPALARVRLGGARAFMRLSRQAQEAVLALMARAKLVQEVGSLETAGAFEQEAVQAADRLAAEAGAPTAKLANEPTIAAAGNSLPNQETAALPPDEALPKTWLDPEEPPDVPTSVKNPSGGRAPKKTGYERFTLKSDSPANPQAFDAEFLAEGGLNDVWNVVELKNGEPVGPSKDVLKLAKRGGDGIRSDEEVVRDTGAGYEEVKGAGGNVLPARFFPKGIDAATGRPQPYIVMEALGRHRIILGNLMKLGQAPDRLLRKFFEEIRKLNRKGIVLQDPGPGNYYVEMTKGQLGDLVKAVAKNADCPQCDFIVGCLDTDRVVNHADYAAGRAPASVDAIIAYTELSAGVRFPKRSHVQVPSLEGNWYTAENIKLWMSAIKTRDFRVWRQQNPGAFWPADSGLDFMQEKYLEYYGFLDFDKSLNVNSEGKALGGYKDVAQVKGTKTMVKRSLFKEYWPEVNDSSRFEPFRLGDRRPLAPAGVRPRSSLRRGPSLVPAPPAAIGNSLMGLAGPWSHPGAGRQHDYDPSIQAISLRIDEALAAIRRRAATVPWRKAA